jgi:hypothetical protein
MSNQESGKQGPGILGGNEAKEDEQGNQGSNPNKKGGLDNAEGTHGRHSDQGQQDDQGQPENTGDEDGQEEPDR